MKKFKDYIEQNHSRKKNGVTYCSQKLEIRKISEDVSRSDLDQIERYADKLPCWYLC